MFKNKFIIISITALLTACTNENQLETVLPFAFGNVPVTVRKPFLRRIEDGQTSIFFDDKLFSQGELKNGKRIGEWSYFMKEDSKIEWEILKSKDNNFSISLPAKWTISSAEIFGEEMQEKCVLYAEFDDQAFGKGDFRIFKHNLMEANLSPKQFASLYLESFKQALNLEKIIAKEIKYSRNELYYFQLIGKREGKDHSTSGIVFQDKETGFIFEITLNSDITRTKEVIHGEDILFFEILYSMEINSKRLLKMTDQLEIKKSDLLNSTTKK